MLRKVLVFSVLCLVPAMAHAQTAKGPFELSVSGSGNNGPNFNGFAASGNGSIGYFFTDALELGFRQSASYSDFAGPAWQGSSRVAIDLHFPLGDQGQIVPFIGGNGGYTYGSSSNTDQWELAPEGGIKLFVNGDTFVFAQVEYQFFLNQHSTNNVTLGNDLRQGQFLYTVGVGWRF